MADTTREERLTALEDAVTEWADRRIEQLEAQAEFLRSVFDGRTSGGRLADYAVSEASALLDDEINAFLTE
jgi:hypothetical protein